MIKKISLLTLVVCLLLIASSPVQAQGELVVLDNSAQPEFPLSLKFNLSAQSDVPITDIRLCYTVDRSSFAEVTSEVYIGCWTPI